MLSDIQNLVENDLSVYPESTYKAFIIGEQPSNGARSPLLWNKAFKAFDIDATMVPLDVKQNNLSKLFDKLEIDSTNIGGCIAAPYKEKIAKILGKNNLIEEASNIGAINNFFKKDLKSNKFFATNTDGEAALNQIKELLTFNNTKITDLKEVVILGTGGTSKAVAAYLSKQLSINCKIKLFYHNKHTIGYFYPERKITAYKWALKEKYLITADLIINCTSVGTGNLIDICPFNLDELIQQHASKKLSIYDVNYLPSPPKLIEVAKLKSINAIDGKGMNLIQAVLAFKNSTSNLLNDLSISNIKKAMLSEN